jgi:imidazolonepropionase-like amidohydrolase
MSSSTAAAQSPPTGALAFTHVTVIDTARGVAHDDQTVLVAGERITEVGKAGTVNMPTGAHVVPADGKFLIPGLWDMHVHTFAHGRGPRSTQTWFFPLFIANGVTGVRDMWTTGDDFLQLLQFRKGLADGPLLVPRYGAVGWLTDGPSLLLARGQRPDDVVSTPQEARDFVRRVKAAGLDFVKLHNNVPRAAYFALADEANKAGIPFEGHVPFAITAAEASDAGQRSMEHLFGTDIGCSSKELELQSFLVQGKGWGPEREKDMVDTYDQKRCEELLQKFARNQTWQAPTLGAAAGEPRLASDARNKYVPATLGPGTQQERPRGPGDQYRQRIVAMMNRAGVPLLAGTDVAAVRLYPGFSLHDQLALLVQAGLTPGEALKSATYNPAKFLNMLDHLGTVENGKLADLVLLDANPLDDIHNTQKIDAVVVNGRYLDRRALDKLLADAASSASIH